MSYPKNIPIIDLMMGIPFNEDRSNWYEFMKPLLLDKESKEMFTFPAEYMFKDVPKTGNQKDFPAYVIREMDKYRISKANIGFNEDQPEIIDSIKRYPDRFFLNYPVNPNKGMDEVREIRRLHKKYNIKSVDAFPSGLCPQVPINDKKWYPIYAACIDLDIPFCCCVGVPGPRLPMEPQRVELIDEVCWFFPELKFVMKHGAEPWEKLAVKLMLKYPNLFYMTSAFSPKYYPKPIIDFANTRGTNKIMYAGYFPMGLSLERIFKDMEKVPFKSEVWPKFLSENAIKVFNLNT
ncbi:uncharacterized protein METZ01_LOCUS59653 [marine metagenome]|uniref:Amidohydrolase-related domain-containing protein n=1 Tax=marine metagenome TaxID=408172 RepID=A0A381STJ0_9ZZZZ|tara:strand:+ start:511 stop:1386 length:876 start_codon:yes stop_codon:yes gene_type:complete